MSAHSSITSRFIFTMSTSVTLTKSRLKRTSNGTATYTPVQSERHWRKILEEEYMAVIAERRAYEGATATPVGLGAERCIVLHKGCSRADATQ